MTGTRKRSSSAKKDQMTDVLNDKPKKDAYKPKWENLPEFKGKFIIQLLNMS